MVKELEKVYAFLDTIKPECKTNDVVEAIRKYLLADPNGIQLVQNVYSGMDLSASLKNFEDFLMGLQNGAMVSPNIINVDVVEPLCVTVTASDVEFIETAGIKKADYDWYTFSGLRKKKFKYANKEYIVAPGGIVGIGKNKDLQGKHSCCIFDANNRDTAIQLRSKDVSTFLKRCKPFEGDVEAVFNPNPTGHRVAVG